MVKIFRRHRGSVLVMVLLLSVILFTLGLGFLGQRVALNKAAKLQILKLQARAMAESGLDDARIKLAKKYNFPPLSAQEQRFFRYTEIVTDQSGRQIGWYQVDLDTLFSNTNARIVKITSKGMVGTFPEVEAESVLHAEIDIAEFERAGIFRSEFNPNPSRFKVLYVKEGLP